MKYLLYFVISLIALFSFALINNDFHPNKDLLGHRAYINKKAVTITYAVKAISIGPSKKRSIPVNGPTFLIDQIAGRLHKGAKQLTATDLLKLKSLSINIPTNHSPFDLSLISELKNLTNLNINGSNYQNTDFLTKLPQLNSLGIFTIPNSHTDISLPTNLGKLTQIRWLVINHMKSGALSQLATLTHLQQLAIYDSTLISLKPLSQLTSLKNLSLFNDKIKNITPLENCTALQNVQLTNNDITDISALKNLQDIKTLLLDHNQISDLNPLKTLTQLQILGLTDNPIKDLTPLKGKPIHELLITGTNINSLSTVKTLNHLVRLDMNGLSITSVLPLKNLAHLRDLYLDENKVIDWKELIKKNPHLIISQHPMDAY